MALARAARFFFGSLLLTAATACGDPPDKEIQQAQGALDAARAAGADRYAADEFKAAQDALARANEAVSQRDYRLALNHALDSRERAQNSAKLAADGKAAARVEADRALTAGSASLASARIRLKGAETSRATAKAANAVKRAIADAERQLQEARAAFDQGNYAEVVAKVDALSKALTTATNDLAAAGSAANRRRR
jgi:hypothetical protein